MFEESFPGLSSAWVAAIAASYGLFLIVLWLIF